MDEDFIALRRFGYSLQKVTERYPDGCPNHVIAAALLITPEEVDKIYSNLVIKLRELMGVQL